MKDIFISVVATEQDEQGLAIESCKCVLDFQRACLLLKITDSFKG